MKKPIFYHQRGATFHFSGQALRSSGQALRSSGQALVMLLVFMIFAVTVTTAAVSIIVANSLAATRTEEGEHAFEIAESGMENALIRLLRDPDYLGETLTVGGGNATVTVTGTNPKTIRSEGVVGDFARTVEAQATFVNTIMSVSGWQEIYN